MSNYFGTDGIRLHAEEFNYDFLNAIIDGLVNYHMSTNFSLIIGGDTRISTANILRDLELIASAKGIHIINVGIFPTPAINFYLGYSGADFAIDITASHNPATYNGLKIFEINNGAPTKLCAAGCEVIEKSLQNIHPAPLPPASANSIDAHAEAIEAYLAHLRDYVGACDFRGQKLVLDCANGATSVIAGRLFTEFGAEVTLIHADQNFGTAINDNCGSTHPASLSEAVLANKCDFGAAFDGDGDRCILVDNFGNIVDGDKILAILAEYLELRNITISVMANQGLFAWASSHGVALEVTDVGDQNIYHRMLEKGIRLGGEQSGHIILPFEQMGDGMLTALMLTKIISERHLTLNELTKDIPTMPQILLNISANKEQKSRLSSPAAVAIIDKYSQFLSSKNGRLLVRPSGTEDLVRLTMWGDENLNLEALAAELAKELQGVL